MFKKISLLLVLFLISFQPVFAEQVNLNNDIPLQSLQSGSDVFESVYSWSKEVIAGDGVPFKVINIDSYLLLLRANLVFDNSDPSNPELIGSFNVENLEDENMDENNLSVEVLKEYIWLYDYSGLPDTVKRKKLLNVKLHAYFSEDYVVIEKNHLIISNHKHKIKIYDISDIFNPVLKSSYKDVNYFFDDIKVEGDYLYALSSNKDDEIIRRISIFDLKNLNNIKKIADYDFDEFAVQSFDVKFGYIYLFISDGQNKELIVLDARNPNTIKKVGVYNGVTDEDFGYTVEVTGNYLFSSVPSLSNYEYAKNGNFSIFLVADIKNIVKKSEISLLYRKHNYTILGNFIYFSGVNASVSGGKFAYLKGMLYLDVYKINNLDLTEPSPNASLQTFKSKVKGNKILLRWKTVLEVGVQNLFVIKKIKKKKGLVSAQNAGKSFRTLKRTKITPKGSTSEGAPYRFSDSKVKKGKVYKYIIKFKGFDGEVHKLKKFKVPFN